jgi:hypothetical protein
MGNKDLFQQLKELKLPSGKYAVFGSGPMCIRGWKDCSHDLDIIVTKDVWDEYLGKEGWEVRTMHQGSEYLWNDDLELWKDWGPGQWNIKKLIERAERIDDLPFVRLETVIEWKKLNAREKDLKDIEIIEKFLRSEK